MSEPTLFQKIISGEIPADIVAETDRALVFRDICPQAPVHLLTVPKKPFPRLAEVPEEETETLGHLLQTAKSAASDCGLDESGYRLVINNGPDAGETVPHLHVHVLGGRKLQWPPG